MPPTETFQGVELMPLTDRVAMRVMGGAVDDSRVQVVGPESPLETKTVWPWAAACSQRLFQN